MATIRIFAALALLSSLQAAPAAAEDYPSRPVRVIVPFAPGGPVDVLARAIGEGFRERTGQTMVVENKPGGNTSIGATACKSAEPDGYTICMLTSSTVTLNPFLYSSLTYDPAKDLEPVSKVVIARQVLLLNASVPVKSFAELVAYSKKNPDKLTFGSFGTGGDSHLIIEWLNKKTGMHSLHIPYPGAAPATIAFDRGDIQLMFPVSTRPILDRIKSGKARGLLVAGNKRDPNLPDVPTFKEAGLPDLGYETWFALFAPANIPKDRLAKLGSEIAAIVHTPSFVDKYVVTAGFDAVGSLPAAFKSELAQDMASGRNLVAISGIKITQ